MSISFRYPGFVASGMRRDIENMCNWEYVGRKTYDNIAYYRALNLMTLFFAKGACKNLWNFSLSRNIPLRLHNTFISFLCSDLSVLYINIIMLSSSSWWSISGISALKNDRARFPRGNPFYQFTWYHYVLLSSYCHSRWLSVAVRFFTEGGTVAHREYRDEK